VSPSEGKLALNLSITVHVDAGDRVRPNEGFPLSPKIATLPNASTLP
jgi:hypothetical protein